MKSRFFKIIVTIILISYSIFLIGCSEVNIKVGMSRNGTKSGVESSNPNVEAIDKFTGQVTDK